MSKPLTRAGRKALLAKMIQEAIAAEPFMRGGYAWAAIPQPVLADAIGVTERTIYDWTGKPPYQREQAMRDGLKVAIVRMLADGEAPARTPEHVANIMRQIWQEEVPAPHNRLTPRQHGCLVWLARLWPEGSRIKIFRHCVRHWQDFVTAGKHILECEADLKGEEPHKLFFVHPNIPFMRKVHVAGPCVYAMALQGAQKPVPANVMAIYKSVDCL